MKNIIFFLVMLYSLCSLSQDRGPQANSVNDKKWSSFESDKNDLGRTKLIKRSKKGINGYKHLWKEWNQQGIVTAANGNKYKVKNINFNAKNNWFEIKVHPDSLYAFNRKAIDNVVIENREFVNLFFPELERPFVVELMGRGANFTIVKKYEVELVAGSPNPMRGSSNDKYKINYSYFLSQGDKVEKFKLKKSTILQLYPKKENLINSYAKENKLSFKNAKDLAMIFAYANQL